MVLLPTVSIRYIAVLGFQRAHTALADWGLW